mgnify:CR=1 FL=1
MNISKANCVFHFSCATTDICTLWNDCGVSVVSSIVHHTFTFNNIQRCGLRWFHSSLVEKQYWVMGLMLNQALPRFFSILCDWRKNRFSSSSRSPFFLLPITCFFYCYKCCFLENRLPVTTYFEFFSPILHLSLVPYKPDLEELDQRKKLRERYLFSGRC